MSSVTALHLLLQVDSDTPPNLQYLRQFDPSTSQVRWLEGQILKQSLALSGPSLSISATCRRVAMAFVESSEHLAQLAARGRDSLASNLSEDEAHVFRQSGLFEPVPDSDCLAWWNRLRSLQIAQRDDQRMHQGRTAELWSMELERVQAALDNTVAMPEWVALDGDWHGYDIKAYRSDHPGFVRSHLIEVKSYSRERSPQFFVTRNEWQTAVRNRQAYEFQIWCMETKQLHIKTVDDIAADIPDDQGNGEWQNVLIRFPAGDAA